ncbi:monocarboxylate transporter 9-like, partial [Saccoglossus kowalevskii]|uniref:Monocarboxylate transporter 9-like n=1 Tax=Saccoglossus kowalevskii TaxID=10224 RepID=A0ABM0M342_SACKO
MGRLKESDPPDGGWGWVIVFSAFTIQMIVNGSQLTTGLLYVSLKNYFNESATTTAWVLSLSTALMQMSGPLGTYIANKFGIRPTVIIGGAVSTAGFLLSSFAPNVYYLYFTHGIVASIGHGLCFGQSLAILPYYFEKRFPIASSLTSSGTCVGLIVYSLLYQVFLEIYGWKGTYLLVSALNAHLILCGVLFRPI